ncbi:MAG: hypothetical protein PHQ62_01095 [Clostridia bacterium]|nr:hypothetical protein [Clostridia bacterium]
MKTDELTLENQKKYSELKRKKEHYEYICPQKVIASTIMGLGAGTGVVMANAVFDWFFPITNFEIQQLIPNFATPALGAVFGASFGLLYPKYVVYKTNKEITRLEKQKIQQTEKEK